MKATGIVRRLDGLGRLVLPKELRRTMKMREGEPIEIFVEDDNTIVLKKYNPGCSACGEVKDGMIEYHGKLYCQDCINELHRAV